MEQPAWLYIIIWQQAWLYIIYVSYIICQEQAWLYIALQQMKKTNNCSHHPSNADIGTRLISSPIAFQRTM